MSECVTLPRDTGHGAARRRLRLAAGLTQTQLAAQLGVSVQAVRRWEHGVHQPRGAAGRAYLAALAEIASGLGDGAVLADAPRWTLSPAWLTALAGFLSWQRAAGTSERTLTVRLSYLRRLGGTNPDPWSLTTADLMSFQASPGWAPESRKSARAALRAFYRWALVTEQIAKDPAAPLPPVRVPPGRPRPAPDGVLQAALARAGERERMMLLLAAFAGLRRAEIARVHSRDLVDGVLFVKGKGGRVREIPLPAQLVAMVEARPDGYLFPGRAGGHITPDHVGKLLAGLLGDGWTGHKLRHRFATAAYVGSRDLFAVQKLLGHARPETTAVYTLVAAESLRAAVACAAVGFDEVMGGAR